MAGPGPEPDPHPERRKRTLWLIVGGAASLILPLLGAVYLHMSSNAGAQGPSGRNDLFQHREFSDKRLTPSQVALPAGPTPSSLPAPGAGTQAPSESSLDFVKPSAELAAKTAEAPKPAATAPAAAPPPPVPAAAPAKTAPKTPAKKGKKEFVMPKLQPSRGFTQMGHGGQGGQAAPAAGGGNDGDLMKNLPPGAADNPQLQQYLKQQGK